MRAPRRRDGARASSLASRLLILALLFISGLHPNPGPRHSLSTILQFNCNGLRNTAPQLRDFLKQHNVLVACIQETKLSPSARCPSFGDYHLLRHDRPRGHGGGLGILVHHSVTYRPFDVSRFTANDDTAEIFGINATICGAPLIILNVYVPPASSCPQGYSFDAAPIFNLVDGADTVILGDFNAHHSS